MKYNTITLLFTLLPALLFVIFAFAAAKRNVKLFIIPLAIRAASALLELTMLLAYFNFTTTVASLAGTLLSVAALIVFCLTVTGKIRSNQPIVIVFIVSAALNIFTAANYSRVMLITGSIPSTQVWLSPVQSVLISAAYILLGLSLSNDTNRRYYQKTAYTPVQGGGYNTAAYNGAGYAGGQRNEPSSNVPPELYETKSTGVCILLLFVTFGIYGLYWLYTFCKKSSC